MKVLVNKFKVGDNVRFLNQIKDLRQISGLAEYIESRKVQCVILSRDEKFYLYQLENENAWFNESHLW